MKYVYYNPNPAGKNVGDCVVRAISKLFDMSWEDAYLELAIMGGTINNMPSANEVWGELLSRRGFTREAIPNTCPNCYSVADFVNDHPEGTYLLATGNHVVTVIDGKYYDAWDSGKEVPVFYWRGSK